MFDTEDAMTSVMTEMGIDPSNLDDSSDSEMETESTEAEGEVTEETVNDDAETEDDSEESVVNEDEETEEVAAEVETTEEEPKLTVKEFRELEAKRLELEEKEKAITERFAAQEKEFEEKYHEKVKTHDEIDSFLLHLSEKDPELFDLFKGEFAEFGKQFSNPVINELKQKNEQLEKKLDSFLSKTSDEVTLTKLDSEMKTAKESFGKDAEAAGLKVDWDKVKNAWAENPKLGLKNAFFAEYGEAMLKASVSKAKVDAVTKKVEARPKVATAGSVGKSNSQAGSDYSGMSTIDVLKHEAKKFTGKLIS